MLVDSHEWGRAGQYLKLYEGYRYASFPHIEKIVISSGAEPLADLSFYDGEVDWDEYVKHARAAILRIGQGSWEDPQFQRNYQEARDRGVILGGYWFHDGRFAPEQQRDTCMAALSGKYFDMEIFVDYERLYGGNYEGVSNVVKTMKLLEAVVNAKDVGVYTGFFFWQENTDARMHAAEYAYVKNKPLWLPWYDDASNVQTPPPWTTWRDWQFGTPVEYWGQQRIELDRNLSVFTRSQFTQFYAAPPIPPPPPQRDGIISFGTVLAPKLNLRRVPAADNNVPIGSVVANQKLVATGVVNGWWKVLLIDNHPVAQETYAYEGATHGYIRDDYEMPVSLGTEIKPKITVTNTFTADGYPPFELSGDWTPSS